jgi:hypothetical protein
MGLAQARPVRQQQQLSGPGQIRDSNTLVSKRFFALVSVRRPREPPCSNACL